MMLTAMNISKILGKNLNLLKKSKRTLKSPKLIADLKLIDPKNTTTKCFKSMINYSIILSCFLYKDILYLLFKAK